MARAWGDDTPSEPESSRGDDEEGDEDEEEVVVTPPPNSLPPKDVPSIGDLFCWQEGISFGARRLKQPQTETGPAIGPSP
jgi:hypothetical protein